jgi:hypothetical protein
VVPLTDLWLPILLSAVAVFVVSSIINMFLPYHRSDYRRLPEEEAVLAELRRVNLSPGEYGFPYAASPKELGEVAYKEKTRRGPVGSLTIAPSGDPPMARSLVLWFLYALFVSVMSGYMAGRALPPGTDYLQVFRFSGTTAFAAYVVALWQFVIWFSRPVSTTLKFSFDGLIYALVTAGMFGWLWP